MAKKKKSRRQRSRAQRPAELAPAAAPVAPASAPPAAAAPPQPVAEPANRVPLPVAGTTLAARSTAAADLSANRWVYVQSDLRRLGVLAVGCIALEVILWLLFTHTGLGNTVYGWVKL